MSKITAEPTEGGAGQDRCRPAGSLRRGDAVGQLQTVGPQELGVAQQLR